MEQKNELRHYGVLGMKWGVRRYQKKDGTRTALGKKREHKARETLSKLNDQTIKGGKDKPNKSPLQVITKESENSIRNASDILKVARKNKKQTNRAKGISDEELRKRINRLKLENEYNNLTEVETGMDRAIDALQVIGSVAAIGTSAAVIAATIYGLKK